MAELAPSKRMATGSIPAGRSTFHAPAPTTHTRPGSPEAFTRERSVGVDTPSLPGDNPMKASFSLTFPDINAKMGAYLILAFVLGGFLF